MQLVIGRAKRALCSSWLNNRRLGSSPAPCIADGGETRSKYATATRAVGKEQRGRGPRRQRRVGNLTTWCRATP